MDTHLALDVKSSSFNVKDLLELPEHKAAAAAVYSQVRQQAVKELAAAGAMTAGATVTSGSSELATNTSHTTYYDQENPYTRWLQNNETMPYASKNTFPIFLFLKRLEYPDIVLT